MRMPFRLRALVAAIGLAVGACAPRGAVDQTVQQNCAGMVVAIVTNSLSYNVDIQTTIPNRTEPITLGMVNPGERREFELPAGARRVYPMTPGRGMPDPDRDRVLARYECR